MKGDDAEVVAGAVAGLSLSRIAGAAGVSVSTVQRRLNDPRVQDEIRRAKVQQQREALAQMTTLRNLAMDTLEHIMKSGYP